MRKLIVKAIRIQLVHAVIQRKAKNQSIKLTFNSEKNKIKNSRKSKSKLTKFKRDLNLWLNKIQCYSMQRYKVMKKPLKT